MPVGFLWLSWDHPHQGKLGMRDGWFFCKNIKLSNLFGYCKIFFPKLCLIKISNYTWFKIQIILHFKIKYQNNTFLNIFIKLYQLVIVIYWVGNNLNHIIGWRSWVEVFTYTYDGPSRVKVFFFSIVKLSIIII